MPQRILVICGDQYHASHEVMLGLENAGKAEFHFQQADNASLLAGDQIFQAVVLAKLNVTSAEDSSPWADQASQDLIHSHVTAGRGLLVIHAGTVGYQPAPIIRELTGGSFQQHPEACDVELVPTAHPLAAGVVPYTVHDEHYFVEIDSDVDLFLSSRSAHGSQPAGWIKEFGNARICTLTPGHGPSVWANDSFQLLIRNALSWVTHA
ncbi:MAG: ThuA domain-containing protein [Armatimonadota bacterium]